jgi:hypothetical protein
MLKKQINCFVNHYGLWRSIHIAIAAGIITLAGVLVLELVIPVRLASNTAGISSGTNIVTANRLSEVSEPKFADFSELASIVRRGLFKSATPSRDKPMADKTIERIRSQVELQCIMELNGERVAYVNIKGTGLKKCKVGDCVNDLFTVLNIDGRSIEITVVGHKTKLNL